MIGPSDYLLLNLEQECLVFSESIVAQTKGLKLGENWQSYYALEVIVVQNENSKVRKNIKSLSVSIAIIKVIGFTLRSCLKGRPQ